MRKRWMRLALWCVILVLLAAIALFSAQNGEASQKLSDGVVQRLLTLFWSGYAPAPAQEQARVWQTAVLVVRKGAHATEFLLLGAALYLLLRSYAARRAALCAWSLAAAYGALDEIHQLFSIGRAGRITDVLIDASGAALGVWLVWGIMRLAARKRKD